MTQDVITRPVARGAESAPRWKRHTFAFLGGQLVSSLGSMLVSYAVMWHLTLQTRSGAVLTISVVVSMLPQALTSVFGGVWADRHSRKRLIMVADSMTAAATLTLALVMLGGIDALWLIFLAMALRSAFSGVQGPAVNALIPQLVPEEHLARLNGVQQSAQSGIMLAAPALAATLYATTGLVPVFLIAVASAAIGLLVLGLIPVGRVARGGATTGYFTDLAAGARYVRSSAPVCWTMAIVAVVMLLTGASANLTPLMIARSFGGRMWMLSVNEVCWSLGMLLGGAVMAVVGPRVKHRVRLIVAVAAGIGILNAGLGVSGNFWVFSALGVLITIGYSTLLVPATTVLQEQTETQMQGRVFGFYGIVISLSMPLSMIVFGPVADAVSVQTVMVLTGVLLVTVTAAIAALPAARRSLADTHQMASPVLEPGRAPVAALAQA